MMTDSEAQYQGNGREIGNNHDVDGSPQTRDSGHGGSDDRSDSKSKHGSRSRDKRESSRSRDKEKERDKDRREKDQDRVREKSKDRDRDRGERRRDRSREHSEKRDRRRDRDDYDDDYDRSRDYDRRRDYDRDREDRHSRRSRSHSRAKSVHRTGSRSPSPARSRSRSPARSRSRSKSKRISGFDMAPPATAMLATSTTVGAAVAPGQIPGTNQVNPGVLPNFLTLATGQFGALPVMPQAMTQQATRHARRVYVGGLSATANEQTVAIFFNQVMAAIGGNTAGPGDAVVNVYINHEKKFAFVEMRSVAEASNAMALDGIIFEGAPVKVRRPTDYNPSLAATLGPSQPSPHLNLAAVGLTPGSALGLESPDRIFVGGLPYYFTEAQIRELLESFGPLRGFDLVKDRETGNSKGYAFCVYQDPAVTDIACAALNGIKMGDKTLTVKRATQAANQPKPEQENLLLQAQQIALQRLMQPQSNATKVVCLTQALVIDDLKDDDEYADIVDDMRQEGERHGSLVNVAIPRPNPNGEPSPGVGKVFLEYADVDGAKKAQAAMNGRKFGGNQVVAVFYPEDKFAQGEYEG